MPLSGPRRFKGYRLWEKPEVSLPADNKDETKTELHNTKNNVQGLLLYHPILIESPWQAPEDLDAQIGRLLITNYGTISHGTSRKRR
jgi:hypothetical protein